MRRAAVVGAVLAAVVLAGCSGEAESPPPSNVDVGAPELQAIKAEAGIETCEPGPLPSGDGELPDLVLPCLGGGPDVDLSSLAGPMVINVWNTNCGPCLDEMPVLQQFHERYGDRVAMVGLDVNDVIPENALSFAAAVGATYPQVADPGGEVFDQDTLRIAPAFPQFVLVDADGRVTHQEAGGITTLDEVVTMVEDELQVRL